MATDARPEQNSQSEKSLRQLKTVDDLVRKQEALERSRVTSERQWKLNLAFYKGDQYTYFSSRTNRIESLSVDDGQKPRHRVRIVSNQIMPGVNTLLAQLTKTKPRLHATPGGGGENEVRAAEMSESLLDYWWQDFNLDEKLDEAVLWAIICGGGYWALSWDKFAAKQMRFTLDPNGQPITDETLKTEFIGQLKKAGVEPVEKIAYMGDIRVDVMSPFDVYLDNNAKTFEECKFAICVHSLDVDEIKSRWGVDIRPDSIPNSPDAALSSLGSANNGELSVRKVYIGYFRPSASMPNGRYVAWVSGSDKQILSDEKWPFPFHQLPLIKIPGMRVPGAIYDDAPVTHAIPLQKELNRSLSQIIEYKNLTINPVMTAPVGSLRTRRTTEPGQVLEYTPINGMKPEFETLPSLPPYVFEHLSDISRRLQETFLSAEVLQGKPPPNVEAGIAIDLLQEMATDKLAPMIKLMELGLARAGQQMLAIAQKYYIEPRLLKIRGSGGATQVKQFVAADIAGNVTVHAETGSGLPRTRAGRQARIERLIELGMIEPRKGFRYMEIADLKDVQTQFQTDEALAYRNIDKILEQVPVNATAVRHAFTQVNQGINPETGEMIQDPAEAQQILQAAALQPIPGIDYDTHLDVTGMFIKGISFDSLSNEVQDNLLTYWQNLSNAKAQQLPNAPAQAPKVSYQIKGTIGPSGASKILNRAGVQITPEEATEAPLETWVTDSVDKPDMDAAGPGQEANELSQAASTVLAAQTAALTAQQDAQHKNQRAAHDYASQAVSVEQAAEMHEQKLREAAAKADLAERKAKEMSFAPKPTSKPDK